jgi:hypothetical protein
MEEQLLRCRMVWLWRWECGGEGVFRICGRSRGGGLSGEKRGVS